MKTNIFAWVCLLLISCSSNRADNPSNIPDQNNNLGTWLIPTSEIKDGGPGKDGIPSIDNPIFVNAPEASFLTADDLIIGCIQNGVPKAYPHRILDWHEVVNDDDVTISYCPLTGSALGWKSSVNSNKTTFGVSGLLYNSNLIMYDRMTDSNWSQMRIECVNGLSVGKTPELTRIVETTWSAWKTLYPNTKVLSLNTGFSRDYDLYPYGDYKTNNERFIFTVSPSNDALPSKERVFGIIEAKTSKTYQFSKFNNGKAIKDIIDEQPYLIVGNENLITAFKLNENQNNLDFTYNLSNSSESFFDDNEGNSYNVFGEVISGPKAGETLAQSKSMVSFWFAFAAFYPNPKMY